MFGWKFLLFNIKGREQGPGIKGLTIDWLGVGSKRVHEFVVFPSLERGESGVEVDSGPLPAPAASTMGKRKLLQNKMKVFSFSGGGYLNNVFS